MEEKDVQRLLDMLLQHDRRGQGRHLQLRTNASSTATRRWTCWTRSAPKLPLEIKKAQELVRAREEYVSSAKKEVEKMLCVRRSWTPRSSSPRSETPAAGPPQEFRDHSPGRGTQQGAVPGGQHLHRGRPAPDGGSHPGRPGRGAGVPRPVPATSNEQMQANQEKLRERRSASEQPQSDENA